MDFKQFLVSQGVSEDQATKITEAMPANKLFISSEENLDIRYAKAKTDLEQAKADLANANKLVSDLKKDNANVESLQKKVTEYETKMTQIETERAQERKTNAIKEALTKAGAIDVEYMSFKLGDVEVDKDGQIKDLESKVKQLKETNPSFFPQSTDLNTDKSKGGYKPIDTKLPNGKTTTLDISKMSVDEINANWDLIKAQSKK